MFFKSAHRVVITSNFARHNTSSVSWQRLSLREGSRARRIQARGVASTAKSSGEALKRESVSLSLPPFNFITRLFPAGSLSSSPLAHVTQIGESARWLATALRWQRKLRKPQACFKRVLLCFQLTRNVRFNWKMYNFKFNYLSRG